MGQRLVRPEWGVLCMASAALSHCEGGKGPQVAVQSRGPGNIDREVYLPQLANLAISMYVYGLCDVC